MRRELCVLIPAIKKNVAFPDDLVKRLAGVTLIQRAIDIGLGLTAPENLFVATDSEEITLACDRAGVRHFYRQNLRLSGRDVLHDLRPFILRVYRGYERVFVLHPYVPLLPVETAREAYQEFLRHDHELMLSVQEHRRRVFDAGGASLRQLVFSDDARYALHEIKGF